MPGRNYSNGSEYRYRFNGQEKSNEVHFHGFTAEFWQYDSRLARRWNLDPKPTVGVSEYSTLLGNPIWHKDILGDSIGPGKTKPYNVFVVGKTRDLGSKLSFSRFKKVQENNTSNTILIESDKLDNSVAEQIKSRLGTDGYVSLLALDYHRSDYDNMENEGKDNFYSSLSNGVSGEKTEVFLGMCWAGGGPRFGNKEHPDLTLSISKKLDKATVYGLKTEANNLSFWYNGNFGGLVNPAYAFNNDHVSKNEKTFASTWTISTFSSKLKTFTSVQVRETIKLSVSGKITREPYLSDMDKLYHPQKVKWRDY